VIFYKKKESLGPVGLKKVLGKARMHITRKQSIVPTGVALLFCTVAGDGGRAADKAASLEWPEQATVFAPFDRNDPVPPPGNLAVIPDALRSGERLVAPRRAKLQDPFGRLDLAPFLGGSTESRMGRVAYVFLEFKATEACSATIGLGADWWLQAWLDGELIKDTTENGNGPWPPSACDHQVQVSLTPGKHVLAVRFISGLGSSVLAAGGPGIISRGHPLHVLFQDQPPPEGNLLANGGFEEGSVADPFLPQGWRMGVGEHAFQPGELSAHDQAAISGERSLEINTLNDATAKRKILIPFEADLDTVYEIFFKARNIAGEGYVTVSVRGDLAKPEVEYVGAVAESTYQHAIRRGQTGIDRGYVYFNRPDLFLVIEAHGPIHAVLDDVCVTPAPTAKQWISSEQHRRPWPSHIDWDSLSSEVVTPHIPWLRPRDGRRLAVISVMPRFCQRRAVELSQRLDMDAVPIFFESVTRVQCGLENDYWIYDRDNDPLLFRPAATALEKLSEPADCILVVELGPEMVPSALAKKILEKVEGGAGLVVNAVCPHGPIDLARFAAEEPWSRAIQPGNRTAEETDYVRLGGTSFHPLENMDAFYAYGKGRIAILASYTRDEVAGYQRDMPYLVKAVAWATRTLPAVRIADVTVPGRTNEPLNFVVQQSALPGRFRVSLPAAGSLPPGSVLRCWIDRIHGDFHDSVQGGTNEVALAAGQHEVDLDLPHLAGGQHRLHIHLLSNGKGVDWTTVLLDVQPPLSVRSIDRSGGNPYYRAGEGIEGTVVLSAPLGDGQKLVMRLWDADGRLWAMTEPEGSGPRISFSMAPPPSVVLWHRLQAEVVGPMGVQAEKSEEFAIVRPLVDDPSRFDYQMWCVPESWWNGHVAAVLRDQGVTSAGFSSGDGGLARNNIRALPAVGISWEGPSQPGKYFPYHQTQIVGDLKHAPEREPCLTESNFLAQAAAKTANDVKPQARFAPIGYGLAHEWNLLGQYNAPEKQDICFSPTCREHFRAFLKQEYPSLDALNTEWGTTFGSWNEVTPIVLADAIAACQIPRWVDHRRHMDRVTTDFLLHKTAAIRELDPLGQAAGDNFRAGDTTLDSYSGVDNWLLFHEAVTWGGNPTQYLLSFTPPERRHLLIERDAAWHPAVFTTDEELLGVRLGNQPWKSLLSGFHGFGFFPGYFFLAPTSSYHPWLYADWRRGSISRYGAESIARIRSGISRFVHEGRRDHNGIAILYSRSSEHAATAWQAIHRQGPAVRLHPPATSGFLKTALHNLGYGYEALAEAQVASGSLTNHGCRLLILPFSQALPAPVVKAIRQFVEQGGTVLADVRPAIADVHGKPGRHGGLDEVFGVEHDPAYESYVPKDGELAVRAYGDALHLDTRIQGVIAGAELTLNGASVHGVCGDRPAFLVNEFGRGTAMLLNCTLPNESASYDAIRALLVARNIHPVFSTVVVEGGQRKQRKQAIPVGTEDERMADAEGYSAGAPTGDMARPQLALIRNGRIDCLAAWFDPYRLGSVVGRQRITPPTPGHVYNLRTGAYLGKVEDSFEVTDRLESLLAFAVVPYAIESPVLRVRAGRSKDGHRQLQCEADVLPHAARTENHVVQFRLLAPDGTEWRDFAATATSHDGLAAHRIDLPLNAPAGTWNVVAREAISGLESTVVIVLSE